MTLAVVIALLGIQLLCIGFTRRNVLWAVGGVLGGSLFGALVLVIAAFANAQQVVADSKSSLRIFLLMAALLAGCAYPIVLALQLDGLFVLLASVLLSVLSSLQRPVGVEQIRSRWDSMHATA